MSDAFDYLILGGGTAGSRLAARLAEDPAVQVALLEAGPASGTGAPGRHKRPEWGFATQAQPGLNGRSVAFPTAKRLGGCAALARGEAADAAEPADLGMPARQLLAAARRAGFEAMPEAPAAGYGDPEAALALQRLLARPNLRVITAAHGMRLLLEGSREHLRAVGIEYAHEGYQKQLRATREVLLCAGAVQSPQLLMLSGIGPHAHLVENGIGTRLALPGVGQALVDLPEITLRWPAPRRGRVLGLARTLRSVMAGRSATTSWTAQAREAPGVLIRSTPDAPAADLRLSMVSASDGKGADAVHIRLLQPHSRGRVRLDSKDPFAAPVIDPDLLGHREDMERLLRGFRLVRSLLAEPGMAELGQGETPAWALAQSDLQLEHFIRDHARSAGLVSGSCAMGTGPLDVVDAALRVHGVAGLRVVDASVLQLPAAESPEALMREMVDEAAGLLRAAASGPG